MKLALLSLSLLAGANALAQSEKTLVLRTNEASDNDAMIATTFGCTLDGAATPDEQVQFGATPGMRYTAWTYNGGGCGKGTARVLIQFPGISGLPAGATVTSAKLNLYGLDAEGHFGNSSFPGSGYNTTNEGWVERVTGPWSAATVTWNTQPTATIDNRIATPVSTSNLNWNMSVDVTQLVKDIVSNGYNYGFRLRLQDESVYRNVMFATGNHSDSARWPKLILRYTEANPPAPNGMATSPKGVGSIAYNPENAAVAVTLTAAEFGRDRYTVTIFDGSGRPVVEHAVEAEAQSIPVSHLCKGLYIVQLKGTQGVAVRQKFML